MLIRLLKYTLIIVVAIYLSVATTQHTIAEGISGNLSVSGCIIDNDENFDQLALTVTVSYSAVKGTTAPSGTGNTALSDATVIKDPMASPISNNAYYLSNLSPLVNAGNPTTPAYVPEKDINGNVRKYDARADIGAVEYSMIFNRNNGSWNYSLTSTPIYPAIFW